MNWHIDAMVHHIEKCIYGGVTRSIINLPPRNMKSLLASVALPTYLIGKDPTTVIACASYSDDLASRFRLQRQQVMNSPWYGELFPGAALIKDTEFEAITRHNGSIVTTSVRGGMTGRGFNWIIVDDPIKASEGMSEADRDYVNNWMRDTVYSRLDVKERDRLLIVMQRVHYDDLVGFVEKYGEWDKLVLKAIATETEYVPLTNGEEYMRCAGEVLQSEREGPESLAETKKFLGSYNFEAQYQQDPLPPGGIVIDPAWFRQYPSVSELRHRFEKIEQSWDTAAGDGATNAFSCCITFGIIEGRAYVLEVFRGRLPYPQLREQVIRRQRVWGADHVLVERASTGITILQDLGRYSYLNLIPIPPKLDKVARAHQAAGAIQAGKLWLPKDAQWLADFIREIRRFPTKPVDQVDALSQFINWWQFQQPREFVVKAYWIGEGGTRDRWAERNGTSVFGNRDRW